MPNLWTRESIQINILSILSILIGITSSVASETPTQQQEPSSIKWSLNEVLEKKLLGIEFESPGVKERLLKYAEIYKKIREGAVQIGEKNKFILGCVQDEEKKSFCNILSELEHGKEIKHKRGAINWILDHVALKERQIAYWIRQGNLEKILPLSERDFRRGLKRITTLADLNKINNKMLSAPSSCKNSGFEQVLGSKLEEYLPDSHAQDQMIHLYEKSTQCSTGETVSKAHFRLSLHYLIKGDCNKAVPHLDYLINETDSRDYRSRALYWRFQCAKKQNDVAEISESKQSLLADYPFAFHSILALKTEPEHKLPFHLNLDSKVMFRSESRSNLNAKIKVIEALLSIREEGLAREIIQGIEKDILATEPQFRLYIGVLHYRMNDHLKNFKLLSSVFRDNPSLISKPALELNYPQNVLRLDHLAKTGLDVHLLLSLIRQESAFNPKAKSMVGAMGLMQVMPATARKLTKFYPLNRLFEPGFNLKVGAKYFSILLDRYKGQAELALAAYNAGPKRVDNWLKRYPVQDPILFLDLIPFTETREYVSAIARNYYWYEQLYSDTLVKHNVIQAEEKFLDRKLGDVFRLLGG